MTRRVINNNVDIYSIPNQLDISLGSLTLGDLHGNPIKLLYFLFRHQIIGFKKEVINKENTYQEFVTVYEHYGDLLQTYRELQITLHFIQLKITNAEERLASTENHVTSAIQHNSSQIAQWIIQKKHITEQLQNNLNTKQSLVQQLLEQKEHCRACLNQFNHLMTTLELIDNKTLLRLIGDEIADRGNCDYFTLRILEFLQHHHSNVRIILSNHSCEFIYAFEELLNGRPFLPMGTINEAQITSFIGLKLLLEHDLINKEELSRIVKQSYNPALNLIDYSLNQEGITLFSHAPIRFDSIRKLTNRLRLHYDDSSKEALAATIEQINFQFQNYANNNTIHLLIHNHNIHDKTNMSEDECTASPLVYFIWNRWNLAKDTDTARPATHNGYTLTYVHGHDPFQSILPHIHNLDTLCGKESRKTMNEQINQSFQFLKENQHKLIDKTATEDYLRNVNRYKVFDSDEHDLKTELKIKPVYTETNENGSLKTLSLLGRPVIDPDLLSVTLDDQEIQPNLLSPKVPVLKQQTNESFHRQNMNKRTEPRP
ncbi:Dot/Icm T4SS effector Wip [Legionella bononiensis]|uniref:Type IV secretion protein Dot n=1 Tax=Legionella bononiensis TaxID=2793102 RepID=A0ABS1W776_9GAMM|nr:Dot/Icm T4SS effector Wip [Legionella bononiensis]MBL7481280.1 type IV secretion protein Dot [Legionella bononiensis]MBL7525185.1 type IV secretion protein Dot [Legionella bononiensis]MBL7561368.1 type IV secretion protein Dot [Legionella bononiensis]